MDPRGGPRFLWAVPTQPPSHLSCPPESSCVLPGPLGPSSSPPPLPPPSPQSPVWEKAAPAGAGMRWLTLGQSWGTDRPLPSTSCPSICLPWACRLWSRGFPSRKRDDGALVCSFREPRHGASLAVAPVLLVPTVPTPGLEPSGDRDPASQPQSLPP